MQFLVYLTVLMVSISTVLLEVQWLTTPSPQPKPAVQTAVPVPVPKAEGPSAALSPIYPKKPEAVQATANPQPPATQAPVQRSQTPVNSAPVKPNPPAETTGLATRAEDTAQPPGTPATTAAVRIEDQQTSAVPPEATTARNRCDVQACASAYKSFRAFDCTYQPYEGERRLCTKQPVAARSAARETGNDAAATRRPARDVEFSDRQVDRYVRSLRDDEDDRADFDDSDRDEPRLFLFGGRGRRW
jgi:BA14K-like protein